MHDDLIDAVDWAIGAGDCRSETGGLFRRKLWRLFGAGRGHQDTRRVRLHCRSLRYFQSDHVHGDHSTYWGPWFSVWKKRLGDPDTEEGRAFLIERSPLTHIDRVIRPILIAQGMRDVRVVPANRSRWWPRSSSAACPSPT